MNVGRLCELLVSFETDKEDFREGMLDAIRQMSLIYNHTAHFDLMLNTDFRIRSCIGHNRLHRDYLQMVRGEDKSRIILSYKYLLSFQYSRGVLTEFLEHCSHLDKGIELTFFPQNL